MLDKEKRKAVLDTLVESSTLTEAAKTVGMSRGNLLKMIRADEELSFAYRVMLELSAIRRDESLQEKRDQAIDFFMKVMNDDQQRLPARISAAKAVVDITRKQSERVSQLAQQGFDKNAPSKWNQ